MEQFARLHAQNLVNYLKRNSHNLVIDADTHPSDRNNLPESLAKKMQVTSNYFHGRPITIEELLQEMNMAGVDMALCWQNPSAIPYTDDKDENFGYLFKANQYIRDASRQYPDKIIPAGWTDPKALGEENAHKMVERCILDFGFLIVKMNPAQNAFPIDSAAVMSAVDKIVSLGGIPAFHYGADTVYTPAQGLERIATRHPEVPIIAVHMGGGGASYPGAENLYQESRALGLRCPNIHYVLSSKRDTHMESDLITYQMAGEPFCNNISCASDAPYGRQSWNFGGFRGMFASLKDGENHPDLRIRNNPGLFNDQVIQRYLGTNFSKLLIRGYEHLLAVHDASW